MGPTNQSEQSLFSETDRVRAAFVGQTGCATHEEIVAADDDQSLDNCAKLNGRMNPYFDLGVTKFNSRAQYQYMSTRNNNYTNRGQKGTINIGQDEEELTSGEIAAIAVGTIAGAAVIGVAALACIKYGAIDRLRFRKMNKKEEAVVI